MQSFTLYMSWAIWVILVMINCVIFLNFIIAVTFLALLELSKRREVEVRQDALWGPITILQGVSE